MMLTKFASAVSASFLNLIYHGAGTVVNLLLLNPLEIEVCKDFINHKYRSSTICNLRNLRIHTHTNSVFKTAYVLNFLYLKLFILYIKFSVYYNCVVPYKLLV